MIGNGSSGSLTLESGNVTIHNSGNDTLGSIQLGTNSDTTVGELTINGGKMQVDGRILIAANKTGAQAMLTMNGGQLTLGDPGSYATSGDPACGGLYLNGTSEYPIASKSLFVEEGWRMFKGNYAGNLFVNEGALLSPGNSVGDLFVDGAVTINGGATLLLEQDSTGMDSLTATRFIVSPNAILDLAPAALQHGATYTLLAQTSEDFSDEYNVDFWKSLLSEEDAYIWNLSVVNNMLMATIDPNAVPEPSTWALLVFGVCGLLYLRKRFRS